MHPAPWIGFDVDGTLIDTWARQIDLLNVLLSKHGLSVLDAEFVKQRKREGASNRDVLREVFGENARAEASAKLWIEEIEDEAWLARDTLLPGALESLRLIREAGARVLILSARQRPQLLESQARSLGILALVDELLVASPANAAVEKADALLARRVRAYVGDSDSDGRACAVSGVPFIAVLSGQHSASRLVSLATVVVPGVIEATPHALSAAGFG